MDRPLTFILLILFLLLIIFFLWKLYKILWIKRIFFFSKIINDGRISLQLYTKISGIALKFFMTILQEEETAVNSCDSVHSNLARKRPGSQNGGDLAEDEDVPGKRVRTTTVGLKEPKKELDEGTANIRDDTSSTVPASSKGEVDNGPVQQLVAMFGALVAQGEKAVASLEILISSISADLLAEVVMANMCYLPPNHPNAEGDDEQLHDISIFGSHDKAKYPPSFVAGVMSLSSTFPPVASLLDAHQSLSNDVAV